MLEYKSEMNMKKLSKNICLFLVLTFFYSSASLAENTLLQRVSTFFNADSAQPTGSATPSPTGTPQLYDRAQELFSLAEQQGLKKSWYLPASLEAQINASTDEQAIKDLLRAPISQLVTDLYRGKVLPSSLSKKTWMIPKKFTAQQSIEDFLDQKINAQTLVNQVSSRHPIYLKAVKAFQKLKELIESKHWSAPSSLSLEKLEIGSSRTDLVGYLRLKLNEFGYSNDTQSTVFDEELKKIVRQYQADHNLSSDGIVGKGTWGFIQRSPEQILTQARLNIDRLRWLPQQASQKYIYVNLAHQRLSYFQDNVEVLNFRTINGRLSRQTPLMIDSVRNVVLNPTWTVPYSLFVKDKLPHLREDPSYAIKLKMSVINDLTGEEVDPTKVDWSLPPEELHYTLVQVPGPGNALGFIKFPLQNPHSIYLHDTNERHLFSRDDRLQSSGCIRLNKPFDLGEKLLASPAWTVDSLKKETELREDGIHKQRWLKLPSEIPVYLFYQTFFIADDGRIVSLADPYGVDEQAYSAIKKSLTKK